MINFRFHLVSLVAVFLALTIGIVVGASVVNHKIVDSLNHRIDTIGKNADKQRNENRVLSANVQQLESYLTTAAPYVVESRLTAVPVGMFFVRIVTVEADGELITTSSPFSCPLGGIATLAPLTWVIVTSGMPLGKGML